MSEPRTHRAPGHPDPSDADLAAARREGPFAPHPDASVPAVWAALGATLVAFAAATYPAIDFLGRTRVAEVSNEPFVRTGLDGAFAVGLVFVALGLPTLAPLAGRTVTRRWPELRGADIGLLAATTGILVGTLGAVARWAWLPFPAGRPGAWFVWSLVVLVPLLAVAGYAGLAQGVVRDARGRLARARHLTELAAGVGRVHLATVDDVVERAASDEDLVRVRLWLRFTGGTPRSARTSDLLLRRGDVPRRGDTVAVMVDARAPRDPDRMLLSLDADPSLQRPYVEHDRPIESVAW